MTTKTCTEPFLRRENQPSHGADRPSSTASHVSLEFGRFRVLLRQRQLIADGAPIELGTRALDILLVLLEADGSLVTKEQLFSRVWPGIVVAEENLKVQISALRKALGEDRDFIRTEFGRGYRFTAAVRSTVAWGACQRPTRTIAPAKSRIASSMDLAATTAPLVRPELRLAVRETQPTEELDQFGQVYGDKTWRCALFYQYSTKPPPDRKW
jgi:DNA-binding winged helix-turn-helix (wHTH) protein